MIDACGVDYFKVLGLPLLRGRLLSQDDIAGVRNVTVVNNALARKYFGAENPIGRRIQLSLPGESEKDMRKVSFSIVGVVGDFANEGLRNPPSPEAFVPHPFVAVESFGLLFMTGVAPKSLLNSMRQVMWEMEPDMTLTEPRVLDEFLDERLYATPRFGVISFAVCAGVGLLLSLIGIFTITAYTVSLMTHEIGIRMALGARHDDVLRMILQKCLKIVGFGIMLGLGVALLLVPVLRSQLWGVSAFDGVTFAVAVAMLACAGVIAAYLPALRAVRIDPNTALRAE
jgi:ABC-type antimicrobial peptide transport system permease subunit